MAEQVPETVTCQPGSELSSPATGPDRLRDYFIPVTWRNYFNWPLLFLIPLMIMDAFSTTFALSIGHVEKNPVVAGIVMNPPLHLAVKILISVLLFFLCTFLYQKEVAYEGRCPPKFFTLNLFIFAALLLDCYIYAASVVNNVYLLFILNYPEIPLNSLIAGRPLQASRNARLKASRHLRCGGIVLF